MRSLVEFIRRIVPFRPKKLVRPWALCAPVLVLIIALPMLRPLLHPDPRLMSDDERATLATVQAIVERGTLAIDQSDVGQLEPVVRTLSHKVEARGQWYSDQPPAMAALLSGAYWAMHRSGLTFERDLATVTYVLTLLGVAIPAACAAGLIYRMGRLFELERPKRAALAAASVLATGLISYATVLNPHVPAATLVLASAACLVHVTITTRRLGAPLWLAVGGLCAALAAVIDPSAIPFLLAFLVVITAIRWPAWQRLGGIAVYASGAAIPLLLHSVLSLSATGNIWQGTNIMPATPAPIVELDDPDQVDEPVTFWRGAMMTLSRIGSALFGGHGLLSHFPILLLGVLGVTMVMHRHWPGPAKVLAGATLAGAIFLILGNAIHRRQWNQWRDAMFAARWFVVFGPLVLFWAGAWLRRSHRPTSWALVGILLTFSVVVSLIGATNPWPAGGFDRYTAAEALAQLGDRHTVSSKTLIARP